MFNGQIYFEVLLNTPFNELMHACTNNPVFYNICTSPYFWQQKTFRDIGEDVKNPGNLPWNELYQIELDKKKKKDYNRDRLIDKFDELMDDALNGINHEVIVITQFDAKKYTKTFVMNQPSMRYRVIQPIILINGQQVIVPIIAPKSGKSIFEDFVRLIVGRSDYPQLVEPMIQSFNQQL
jgi:hypothetical protein